MLKTLKMFVKGSNHVVTTSFVHTDKIDISKNGPKRAPRVSDVEFDTNSQEWVARLRDGKEIARNLIRETVIADERVIIDGMMERKEPIPGYNVPVFFHNRLKAIFLGHHNNSDLFYEKIDDDHFLCYRTGSEPSSWFWIRSADIDKMSDERFVEALKMAVEEKLITQK